MNASELKKQKPSESILDFVCEDEEILIDLACSNNQRCVITNKKIYSGTTDYSNENVNINVEDLSSLKNINYSKTTIKNSYGIFLLIFGIVFTFVGFVTIKYSKFFIILIGAGIMIIVIGLLSFQKNKEYGELKFYLNNKNITVSTIGIDDKEVNRIITEVFKAKQNYINNKT